jgi:hypothetical protein
MGTVFPMIVYLPPLFWPDNVNIVQFLAVLPFWLGVAATPGYVYAWNGHYSRAGLSTQRQTWVAWSLTTAFVASVTGAFVSALAIVPFPFAVGSAVCSLLLIRRFRRT